MRFIRLFLLYTWKDLRINLGWKVSKKASFKKSYSGIYAVKTPLKREATVQTKVDVAFWSRMFNISGFL